MTDDSRASGASRPARRARGAPSDIARRALLATLLPLGLLAGCATGGGAAAGGPLQETDALLRQAQPGWSVAVRFAQPEVKIGEPLAIEVGSGQPGYLHVFEIGSDRRSMTMVFPNAFDGANYVLAGRASLPRPSWRMRANGPAGNAYFVAVLTAQPQDLLALQAAVRDPRTPLPIVGAYGAAMASVREVD